MKKVALITMIAAFAFGNSSQNSVAANSDNAIEEVRGGSVGMNYDDATDMLSLRITTNGKLQRVSITVMNSQRQVVHKQLVVLTDVSSIVDVPLAGHADGAYTLQVKGDTISYATRFKKK